MIPLDYKDAVTLYAPAHSDYGTDVPGTPHQTKGLLRQQLSRPQVAGAEATTSNSQLWLDPTDGWIKGNHYRLEGMLAVVNPFGEEGTQRYFRITQVLVARDLLLENLPRHLVCDLEKAPDTSQVAS